MADILDSIGTDTRDFSTMISWEASLSAHTGDNVTGECYNDSTFPETGGLSLDDVTPTTTHLTVASGERHTGVAGTGARIVFAAAGMPIEVTVDNINVTWLEVDMNGNDGFIFSYTEFATGANNIFSQMILHDSTGTPAQRAISASAGRSTAQWNNIIIYDIACTHSGTNDCVGAFNTNNRAACRFQNLTIHNVTNATGSGNAFGTSHDDDADNIVQNCIITNTSTTSTGTAQDYELSAPSNAIMDHNMSSDTSSSGTGSLDSGVANDIFVSTVGGSENLHLKSGAAIDPIDAGTDLGTTPTNVNIDIDGRDRDAELDTWDMGADEFVVVGTGTPGVGGKAQLIFISGDLD